MVTKCWKAAFKVWLGFFFYKQLIIVTPLSNTSNEAGCFPYNCWGDQFLFFFPLLHLSTEIDLKKANLRNAQAKWTVT